MMISAGSPRIVRKLELLCIVLLVPMRADVFALIVDLRQVLDEALPVFKEQNPQLAVDTVVRKFRHPMIVGFYRKSSF